MKRLLQFLLAFVVLTSLWSCDKEDDSTPTTELPVLSILDQQVEEGAEASTIAIQVSLQGTSANNVIVNYATIDGTAKTGIDYTGTTEGELIFAAGESVQTIEIALAGDDIVESDETFEIVLLNPINATLLKDRATITILNDDDDTANPLNIPTEGYTTPTSYPDYTLVWADEFDGPSINQDWWTFEIGTGSGGWGNNELQYYREQNAFIYDNDYLVIEAREEPFSGSDYTSSRMVTRDKKEFQYGRVDIRAALPEGQGIWPALWMLGYDFQTEGWPACGEIDIMEMVGNIPNGTKSTIHFGASFAEHQEKGKYYYLPGGEKFIEEFHVFSLIWSENEMRFLVDDNEFQVLTDADVGSAPYPFNDPFFFIFNVAVGGNWPGSPDETTVFPQRMIVDYVRVFQ